MATPIQYGPPLCCWRCVSLFTKSPKVRGPSSNVIARAVSWRFNEARQTQTNAEASGTKIRSAQGQNRENMKENSESTKSTPPINMCSASLGLCHRAMEYIRGQRRQRSGEIAGSPFSPYCPNGVLGARLVTGILMLRISDRIARNAPASSHGRPRRLAGVTSGTVPASQ